MSVNRIVHTPWHSLIQLPEHNAMATLYCCCGVGFAWFLFSFELICLALLRSMLKTSEVVRNWTRARFMIFWDPSSVLDDLISRFCVQLSLRVLLCVHVLIHFLVAKDLFSIGKSFSRGAWKFFHPQMPQIEMCFFYNVFLSLFQERIDLRVRREIGIPF